MPRHLVIAVALLALAVGSPLAAVAQDATPVTLPVTPDPAECTVEPRLLAFFEQFVGTPTVGQATPAMEAATPAAFQMPAGRPADAATVAAVLDTLRQLGACLNAGDFLRYFGLFTDDYFRREFERFGPLPEEEFAFFAAPPEPLPATDRAALLAVVDVRVLEDGRVAGLFDVHDPFAEPPGPARFYWEFVEEDGRWLIDEQVMLGPIEPAAVGTPMP